MFAYLAVSCGLPPIVNNGNYSGKVFSYGNTVEYTCKKGYHLEGPRVIICQSNRTWNITKNLKCERKTFSITLARVHVACVCKNYFILFLTTVYCERPVIPHPGRITNISPDITEFPLNTTLKYGCETGYLLANNSGKYSTCRSNGSWSLESPSCHGWYILITQSYG